MTLNVAASFPQKIDRFIIRKILGKGSQGIVYLAQDPDLNRPVAIKSMRLNSKLHRHDDIDPLLNEARTVSRLQHANIVSVFDIGMEGLDPYLVLEYIDGESLQHKILTQPDMDQKISIMRDVLSDVTAAHLQQIIHCDIKPANILISKQGQAKVADFGLAFFADTSASADKALYGTPQYMAPEYIETRQHQPVSDVFSNGLVFYELLTGQPAFKGDTAYQVLNAIANTDIEAPSRINPEIDERLDALILRSLEKDPQRRYQNAGFMLQAFNDNLSLDDGPIKQDDHDSTISFVLRRMRHKKDFPVFSQTIGVLNQASSSGTDSLTAVSNAILKDFSLTNKVLRLVNSVYYNRGGDKINTISRAVVMLGIDSVRSIASALMLFEHMQNKLQATQLKEDAVQSLFSGLVANQLANSLGVTNHEEAFLCALLQKLGKMLVRFYLHEEAQAIDKLVMQQQCSESVAASRVLGTSYARLGVSVARDWGFPESITSSMQPLDFDHLAAEKGTSKLQLIAQFSNALGECLTLPLQQQGAAIQTLTQQFAKVLGIDLDMVSSLIENCHRELTEYSRLIQFDLQKSLFYQQIPASGDPHPGSDIADNPTHRLEFGAAVSVEILEQRAMLQPRSPGKILADGIQEITNTLTGSYDINQTLQMILETIYRALEGSRVVLCLKDKNTACIKARFGYGENVEAIIDQFSIPLSDQADVFHVAFKNNVDIRIDDTLDEKIRRKIPDWYHQHIASSSFTIFPVTIGQSPPALIYIDSTSKNPIRITVENFAQPGDSGNQRPELGSL